MFYHNLHVAILRGKELNYFVRTPCRPTSRGGGSGAQNQNGVTLQAGIADDQSKDFDFEKTEMKYDSTGMFHWSPAKSLEECILVGYPVRIGFEWKRVTVTFLFSGSKSSGHDGSEWARRCVSVRRPGLAADRIKKSRDATTCFKLPLS